MAKNKKTQKPSEEGAKQGPGTEDAWHPSLESEYGRKAAEKPGEEWPTQGSFKEDGWVSWLDEQRKFGHKMAKVPELRPRHDEATIIHRAEQVIGDREKALRWMGTPVRALGYETPISKLKDEAGAEEVMSVLDALEQGVW